ncbi:MAG: hypothetical protein WDO24_05840 [Pseudomonadota bacterium]
MTAEKVCRDAKGEVYGKSLADYDRQRYVDENVTDAEDAYDSCRLNYFQQLANVDRIIQEQQQKTRRPANASVSGGLRHSADTAYPPDRVQSHAACLHLRPERQLSLGFYLRPVRARVGVRFDAMRLADQRAHGGDLVGWLELGPCLGQQQRRDDHAG